MYADIPIVKTTMNGTYLSGGPFLSAVITLYEYESMTIIIE